MQKVIRGAVCAENTSESISQNSLLLVQSILRANNLRAEQISAAFFTATADLDACYPATAVRKQLLPNASFLCSQEMRVQNSLQRCIRVAVFADFEGEPRHCYLGEAQQLRPDLD